MSEAATKAKAPVPLTQAGRHAVRHDVSAGESAGVYAPSALAMQRGAGNRAVEQLVRSSLAHQVIQRCSCSSGGGKCAKCQHDKEESLRRSATPGAAAPATASGAMVQSVLGTPGHSLEAGLRQQMEGHFGVSLGGVRVHTDSAAAQSAAAVEAHAYTVGQHIVFGASNWAPHSPDGRRLLAHELAHTIQQRGARKSLQPMLQTDTASESVAEREAEGAAEAVMSGGGPAVVHQSVPVLRRAKKKGGGIGQAAKRQVIDEAAGGCGACYGPARLAIMGQDVHEQVHKLVRDKVPWLVDEERFKLGNRLDIPDLFDFVAESPGSRQKVARVGELKPDSKSGRAKGLTQMARYRQNIPNHPLMKNTKVWALQETLPDNFEFNDPTSPAGCPKQKIKIRRWGKTGIYLYHCEPPWKTLVRDKNCKCAGDKEDDKKKKDKKKDPKKDTRKKSDPKAQKKKPPAKKPAPKKPAPKKVPKLKKPGGKVFSLAFGIGINSSSAGAANIGVGISVNSSGVSAGTVGASISYDSDGNAIAAVGASASKGSSSNIAGGAGATAADESSATGAAVGSIGTAKKSDVTGAGVLAQGSADNLTGSGTLAKTTGDAKDADVKDAESGTASPGKTGGKPGGQQGKKGEEEPEAGEGGTPGSQSDVRNSPEFKQVQAEAKRIEAAFAKATPAQQKLMAELVNQYPEHVMPVPDEAFVKKWLNATAGVKDEHVALVASQPWAQGTDIDEKEFKRRVDEVIAGKTVSVEEASPTPTPPPKKETPRKAPAKQDADAEFRGVIAKQLKKEETKPEELREKLKELARRHDYKSMDSWIVGPRDPEATGEQLTLLYFKSKGRNAVTLALIRISKRDEKHYMKVLDASDAVTKEGKTFRPDFIGQEHAITVF